MYIKIVTDKNTGKQTKGYANRHLPDARVQLLPEPGLEVLVLQIGHLQPSVQHGLNTKQAEHSFHGCQINVGLPRRLVVKCISRLRYSINLNKNLLIVIFFPRQLRRRIGVQHICEAVNRYIKK